MIVNQQIFSNFVGDLVRRGIKSEFRMLRLPEKPFYL